MVHVECLVSSKHNSFQVVSAVLSQTICQLFFKSGRSIMKLIVTSHFFHSLDARKLNSNIIYLCDVILCFITPSRALIAGNVFLHFNQIKFYWTLYLIFGRLHHYNVFYVSLSSYTKVGLHAARFCGVCSDCGGTHEGDVGNPKRSWGKITQIICYNLVEMCEIC